MNRVNTVQDYIDGHVNWQTELILLRDLLLDSGLKEEVKWGAPCYTLNGKNVVGIAAFKSYVGLWFHQGVFLKDQNKVLINAQEGTTKALRQWRFQEASEIDTELVRAYIDEAIDNQKAGKEMKPVKAKRVSFPDELTNALAENAELKDKFEQLTPGKKREYAEHIGSGKQEATRLKRLEKSLPLITEGKGLNDKYKK